MGRTKTPVERTHEITLPFSDVEVIKVLSLAVVNQGSEFVKVDPTTGKVTVKPLTKEVKTEISETMAKLAIHRKKIPKLTTKVIKLSTTASNDAIKEANAATKILKELEKARLNALNKAVKKP
ncbi:MAG: hypothetical protein LW708_22855 [Anabaena sp. 49628_E55]|jgi:hypothetical protein|nr:hypothetical protein [Anabaena sp. 49628_E55]